MAVLIMCLCACVLLVICCVVLYHMFSVLAFSCALVIVCFKCGRVFCV